jgi:hypothetical protein
VRADGYVWLVSVFNEYIPAIFGLMREDSRNYLLGAELSRGASLY